MLQLPDNPCDRKNPEVVAKVFHALVNQLVKRFDSRDKQQQEQCVDLPDTIEEFEERFTIIDPSSSVQKEFEWPEIKSVKDKHIFDAHKVICVSFGSSSLRCR